MAGRSPWIAYPTLSVTIVGLLGCLAVGLQGGLAFLTSGLTAVSAQVYPALDATARPSAVDGGAAGGASVRFVGAGLGTTATHGVMEWYCRARLPACHWTDCCHVDEPQQQAHLSLVAVYERARVCLRKKSEKRSCRAGPLLVSLREKLSADLSSGLRALADTPIPHLLPQIMREAPSTRVLLSLRDPMTWATNRVEDHTADIMCKRDTGWEGSCFDLLSCCLPNHTFLHECWALTWRDWPDNQSIQVLARCMTEHVSLVKRLVPHGQLTETSAWEGAFADQLAEHTASRGRHERL